jgi:ABC transport system ATP-binding/permease protein
MAGPIIAQLKDARIILGGANLFAGVDVALSKDERIAFVGPNGAGKSTIMRILIGTLEPDGGERTIAAGATIAFVPQEPDLGSATTLLAYCMAGFAPNALLAKHECEAQLTAWGLDPERATAGLSGGEIRRAALARAFAAEPDLLLMDEPTNHLDIVAIEALEDRLRAYRGAALIVSHDRRFLERVSTVCLWLRNGAVRRLDKGYAHFEDWAVAIEAEEAKALARLETQLAGEEHWFARGVTARRTRNEGRARRLADMRAERRQRKSLGRAKASIEAGKGGDSGRLVIEARDVTRKFPDAEQPIVSDVSIRIMRGDRVGIVGPNGAGKTTLLDMLLKNTNPSHGEVIHGANIELTYVDQARAIVNPSATIWDTLAPNGGDHISVRGRSRHIAAYAKDFLFKPEQLRQPVGALSGGERNRLALAVALARPANLLVLDEPTNDLDMDSLDALEEALGAYDGTVIVVSHDRAFLDGVATQILGALGQGQWAETFGGVSDFEREHGRFRIRAEKIAPRVKTPERAEPAQRKLTYKDERRLSEIESALPRLEQEIAALESALADPNGFATDPGGYAAKAKKLEKAKANKESSEAEWLVLEGKREALTRS